MKHKLRLYVLFSAIGSTLSAQTRPAATLIVTNANVYTVDKQHPKADAMAAIGDRIVAVGSSAEIDSWRGPDTKVIDAGGKLLLPGFDDSHVHFISGGAQLDQVELNDAATPEEFARRIGAQAKKTSKGEWMLGGDWDETKWPKPQLPTKELVDGLTGNTPIFVNRYDGHQSLANSAAMKLAGITAKTPDVAGGVIVRDKSGNPTGIFKDAAMDLINKAIPPMSHERRMRAARRALEHAASVGVTSVQDMNPEFADVAVYSELAQHMAEKDFERFAKLHVIASMQPYHAIDDGRWAEGRLGHARSRYSYAWRSFLDHGVKLAFGTDWFVAPLNPMLGLYAAVTRATLDGKNPDGWVPEEKITLPEAVEAYTVGSAFAEFQENVKGSITPGKLADMVILSDNIFDVKPEAIRSVKVETTIVGGKIVYGGNP